ncbi:MAG: glucosamine-6-phosphate deaminase [Cypionkella sp.]
MTGTALAQSATLRIFDTAAAAEQFVAETIAAQMRRRSNSVLGLATGNSMRGVYRQLVQLRQRGAVSFAGLTSFNLDEYCGLEATDPSSFAAYMQRELFSAIDADRARLHLPDGAADGAARYEAMIAASGGIDLQLLGIGQNGHIGFNEPGSAAGSRTRIVDLAPRTRAVNAADFPSDTPVPSRAVTMGIATILDSRRIVLLATGAAKAQALAEALEAPINAQCPASFLQTHPDLTIACDHAAVARLQHNPEARHG